MRGIFQNLGSFNRGSKHQHPIIAAAQAGDLQRVRLLVQKSSRDVDVVEQGTLRTALHIAAEQGFDGILGELLDRQASAALVDQGGRNPLHFACAHGHAKCVQLLLSARNRDPHKASQLSAVTALGFTPLLVAAMGGHVEVLELLLRAGANVHDALENRVTAGHLAARGGHTQAIALLHTYGLSLSIDTLQRDTLLHEAAAHGHARTATYLMAHGLNPNAQNYDGKSPIDVARAEGHLGVVAVLKAGPPKANVAAGSSGASADTAVANGGAAGAGAAGTSGQQQGAPGTLGLQQAQQQGGGYGAAPLGQYVVHPNREVFVNYPSLADGRPSTGVD